MDIKLKNIKYLTGTKVIAVILAWLCFMSAAASGIFLIYNQDVMHNSSYYTTNSFNSEYSRLVHNAIELQIKLRNEPGIIVSSASQSTVSDNAERYQVIKNRLEGTVNFSYYIKNTATGEVISNVNAADRVALLKKQPSYLYLKQGVSGNNNLWYQDDIAKMLSGTNYEVHTAVVEPLKPGDALYEEFTNFSRVKAGIPYMIPALIASIILGLASFAYLVWAAGRREQSGEVNLLSVDRIYTDVHTLLVFLAAVLSIAIVTEVSNGGTIIMFVGAAIIFGIDLVIGLTYILSMVRQFKKKQLLRNSLTYKLYSAAKEYVVLAFRGKLFKAWTLLVLLGYGAINGVLFAIFLSTWRYNGAFEFLFSGLLLLGFNIAAVYFAAKSLRSLAQIMEAAKELSSGNLDYNLDTKEMSAAFAGFAEDLQGMQSGLRKAVAEAVKGERMKTELITNVSHDLKTPLTSIINYVDLLKKEELKNENAKEYVMVLEEKSARLKQLIEDLIEASKASSGNLSVTAEKVDMHQLVMQAYGEYEEKIEKAGLDIRTNTVEKDVFVLADGKYLWRIIENLLSNALKYSMPNSRVYISVEKNEKYGVLTIKNISAFPLEISPEQLTERFVRGDASRTAEGSGLGLSIAQGLTNLQGGRFKIDIDGDLFKATVEIPLWVEI
ncbi:MAG: signal transduction histidine kinase [Clostridia bacterium]|nr:signal transduction histidine kinase [Clostridia bacterium]